jgi:diaminopimelate epimerase
MCGNGVCAASLYISRIILSSESAELRFIISGREHRTIADKGEITLFVEKPILLHRSSEYQILSVGNKHAVCDIKMFDSVMEVKDKFPDCNLHFTKFVDDFIRVKTYERGVGWTRACGSGAIAIAASQNISDSVRVVHDGGCSSVRNLGDTFSLTVHPKIVFSGNFYDD